VAHREIRGYRIDSSLRHLVAGAEIQPMGQPKVGPLPSDVTRSAASASPDKRPSLLGVLDALPVEAFQRAFTEVEPAMSASQRAMLRGHANEPAQELSMQGIAAFGGYADYASANAQYGRLGRILAETLGVDSEGLENKVQALCVAAGRTDTAGHFVWRVRPQLMESLRRAGWIEPDFSSADDLAVAGARAEVDADESTKGVPETTRRALINARIGQGGFRLRMLNVWDRRCSVTGLGITEALVASHAMAWKDSDNNQRLDEYNGLLLAATVDRLFDMGLISFSDDGRLVASSKVNEAELQLVGLTRASRLHKVPGRCLRYLKAHRERFGFDAS
jgi:hypothetical protein